MRGNGWDREMDSWRRSVQCRDRGQLMRVMAEEALDAERKESLLHLAKYYDALAVSLEREARGDLAAA